MALRWVLRRLLRSTRRARDRVLGSFIVLDVMADSPVVATSSLLPPRLLHGPYIAHLSPEGQEDVATLAGPAAARPAGGGHWCAGPSSGTTSTDWTAASPSTSRRGTSSTCALPSARRLVPRCTPPYLARLAARRLPAPGRGEPHCFTASARASSQRAGGGPGGGRTGRGIMTRKGPRGITRRRNGPRKSRKTSAVSLSQVLLAPRSKERDT